MLAQMPPLHCHECAHEGACLESGALQYDTVIDTAMLPAASITQKALRRMQLTMLNCKGQACCPILCHVIMGLCSALCDIRAISMTVSAWLSCEGTSYSALISQQHAAALMSCCHVHTICCHGAHLRETDPR